jgi:hypothetical protein
LSEHTDSKEEEHAIGDLVAIDDDTDGDVEEEDRSESEEIHEVELEG